MRIIRNIQLDWGGAADSFTGESLNKFLEGNEQDIRNFSRESLYAK